MLNRSNRFKRIAKEEEREKEENERENIIKSLKEQILELKSQIKQNDNEKIEGERSRSMLRKLYMTK